MSVAVLVSAMALVPVAVAWACNPQAHISLNRSAFTPGSTMTVYGSYFATGTITISGPVDSTTAVVDGNSGGGFVARLTAPSSPGSYTVTASRPTGGFAPASFTVSAPAQSSPSTPSASAPQPSAQAPAQAPSSSSPSSATKSPSFSTPSVAQSQRASSPASKSPSNGQSRSNGTTTTTTTPSSGVTTTSATSTQPVFAGSTSTGTGGTFATAPSPQTASGRGKDAGARQGAKGAQTAPAPQGSAFSDVWSAYQPGRTASLMASTGASPSGGTGSQLAWGVGLLAVGLFSLVGGLAYTEARRRRAV